MKAYTDRIFNSALTALLTIVVYLAFVPVCAKEKKPKLTDRQKAENLISERDSIAGEKAQLRLTLDSLRKELDSKRPSPYQDSIAALRNTLDNLNRKAEKLRGTLDAKHKWEAEYLPQLMESSRPMIEKSLFSSDLQELKQKKQQLESFDNAEKAAGMITELDNRINDLSTLDKLRSNLKSALSPQQLEAATEEAARLQDRLNGNDRTQFEKEICTPLNSYRVCAVTIRSLINEFNNIPKVKKTRDHVANKPGSGNNMKGPLTGEFSKFCSSNSSRITTLNSVPYFKEKWAEYSRQINANPFSKSSVETEMEALGF